MADLRFNGSNYKKKTISTFSTGVMTTSDDFEGSLFIISANSAILDIWVVVIKTGSDSSKLKIKVGDSVVANDVSLSSSGVNKANISEKSYFDEDLEVTVLTNGITQECEFIIAIKYAETELWIGTCTD